MDCKKDYVKYEEYLIELEGGGKLLINKPIKYSVKKDK